MSTQDNKQKKLTLGQKFKENTRILKEIFTLIKENKKWWLIPIFLIFALVSFLMIIAGGSSILPAIYALF
jgi:hypothetical protein